MPNTDVIARLLGGGPPAQGALSVPALSLTAATTGTVFLSQLGNAAVLSIPPSLLAASPVAPSYGINFDGFKFRLRVVGKISTNLNTNITIAIQQGTSTDPTVNTTIASTGIVNVNTISTNFFLECLCLWDGVSKTLNGGQLTQLANNVNSFRGLTNAPKVNTQSDLKFVINIISSPLGNGIVTVSLTEFVIEAV